MLCLSREREVQRCEDTLYAESSTVGGQPMMMPHDLLEATTQLDGMLHKLEVAILDIVTDVNNKKKVTLVLETMGGGGRKGGGERNLFLSLSSLVLFFPVGCLLLHLLELQGLPRIG